MATTYLTRNSVYEVDEENKRVRRLRGKNPPTSAFHPDGKWREYMVFHRVHHGGLAFQWSDTKWTITSRVIDQQEAS